MTRERFSAIAHTHIAICCPVSTDRADLFVRLLNLAEGSVVVDYGCGKGAWLRRIASAYSVQCIGLERNPDMADLARRGCGGAEILEGEAAAYAPARIDAALCIGSSGIFGGYAAALAHFSAALQPGGLLLIGEGFWEKEPDPEYLAATGIPRAEMATHAANVESARAAGFVEFFSSTSSLEEWDEYEGLYLYGIESFVAANPDDPDAVAMIERIRCWRRAYLRWGRGTLGLGLYLLRR